MDKKTEPKEENLFSETKKEELQADHFSQTDIDEAWNEFLAHLAQTNTFVYNAINNFKLEKSDENRIIVKYSSSMAKDEFEKLSSDFFNHFRHKVHNFKIEVEYVMDSTIKKEIMTKRKEFDKMAVINPLLKDLDELMKFDLS